MQENRREVYYYTFAIVASNIIEKYLNESNRKMQSSFNEIMTKSSKIGIPHTHIYTHEHVGRSLSAICAT